MCGIAGVLWNPLNSSPLNTPDTAADVIGRMTRAIAHRGPDDARILIEHAAAVDSSPYSLALAFQRLAVLDPDPRAMQPMRSHDGKITLLFNGEIYNFRELKSRLPTRQWLTTGDSEVVLAAYETLGPSFVDELRGMFAIAVVDSRTNTLLLARDRMGQKPLYFSQHHSSFAFASELGAIRQLPWFDGAIDDEALTNYLRFGYILPPMSIYRDVRHVMPGHILTVDLARTFEVSQVQYFREPNVMAGSLIVTPDSVRSHVERAVGEQLVSDVPLGVFLSGGIDSSVVALCASRNMSSVEKLNTFSIGFDDVRYDESAYARRVAQHLGTTHHEFRATPDVITDAPQLAQIFGEPFADSSILPTRLLAMRTKEHVTVALSGDGGDELLGGYDRYRAMRKASSVSRYAPRLLCDLGKRLAQGHPKSRSARVGRFLAALNLTPGDRYSAWMRYFDDDAIMKLTGNKPGRDGLSESLETLLGQNPNNPAACCCRLDRQTYLPGDLLTKVDRCSMLHALEVRSPFMDHTLISHVSRLDDDQLLRGGPKRMLREAFAGDLPGEVFSRAKRGFAVPIGEWLRGPLLKWSQELLLTPNGFCRLRFDHHTVATLLQEHVSSYRDHSQRLWSLLMLELWSRAT